MMAVRREHREVRSQGCQADEQEFRESPEVPSARIGSSQTEAAPLSATDASERSSRFSILRGEDSGLLFLEMKVYQRIDDELVDDVTKRGTAKRGAEGR